MTPYEFKPPVQFPYQRPLRRLDSSSASIFAIGLRTAALLSCLVWPPKFAEGFEPERSMQGSAALPQPQVGPVVDSTYLGTLRAPLLRRDLKISSVQTCAAAACHGGARAGTADPSARRGAEFPLWLENDPHARSWSTLCSSESTRILQRLKIISGSKIVDQAGFDNCLACHNSTQKFNEPRSASWRPEGIGCAACHGPDESWGDRHFVKNWQAQSELACGFVPLKSLVARARVCASCHVGDSDRDMNHDIIAAGHPPLFYEFASYHAQLPKHWRDPQEGDRLQFEPKLWLAGQLASLDASLALLEARASSRVKGRVWPEFSEFACAACHHDLQLHAATSVPKAVAKGAVNRAHYSLWNRAGVEWLLELRRQDTASSSEDIDLALKLTQLQTWMDSEEGNNRQDSAAKAGSARKALDRWVRGTAGKMEWNAFDGSRLTQLSANATLWRQPLSGQTGRSHHDWETAAQFYLSSIAAREAWPGGSAGTARSNARRLLRLLSFPADFSGPPYFSTTADQEHGTTREVEGAIRTLQDSLAPNNQIYPAESFLNVTSRASR